MSGVALYFVISGAILVVSGVLQALVRPRRNDERPVDRWVNRSTIRALVFTIVGALAILLGVGALPWVLKGVP